MIRLLSTQVVTMMHYRYEACPSNILPLQQVSESRERRQALCERRSCECTPVNTFLPDNPSFRECAKLLRHRRRFGVPVSRSPVSREVVTDLASSQNLTAGSRTRSRPQPSWFRNDICTPKRAWQTNLDVDKRTRKNNCHRSSLWLAIRSSIPTLALIRRMSTNLLWGCRDKRTLSAFLNQHHAESAAGIPHKARWTPDLAVGQATPRTCR